jgi:hypothetical protein
MAVGRKSGRTRNAWIMWAFWAAGAVLLLVELNVAMEYFEAGLQQNMGNVLGWVPAVGMITLKLAEQSIWNWSTVGPVLQAVPMGALGLMLMASSFAIGRNNGNGRE